eukprot:5697848-Amphidinium_carterae.2
MSSKVWFRSLSKDRVDSAPLLCQWINSMVGAANWCTSQSLLLGSIPHEWHPNVIGHRSWQRQRKASSTLKCVNQHHGQ